MYTVFILNSLFKIHLILKNGYAQIFKVKIIFYYKCVLITKSKIIELVDNSLILSILLRRYLKCNFSLVL